MQHSSGREIGVNIKYLDNPFGIKYKLNGFELGGCHPFQIRRVYILFQKGWRDIDVALRQLFSISVHLYRSMPPLRSRHTARATLCERDSAVTLRDTFSRVRWPLGREEFLIPVKTPAGGGSFVLKPSAPHLSTAGAGAIKV